MTAQEFFKNDRFATNAGVELIEIKEGYSKGTPGVIDGRASQMREAVRKGVPSSPLPTWHWQQQPTPTEHWPSLFRPISPSCAAADRAMYCMPEARERYIGRTTGYYQIDVTNQEGKLIATFESSVFRKGITSLFSLPQTSSDSGCPGHS